MQQHNVIAIDLAKNSFQVCVLDRNNKQRLNQSMTRQRLTQWLAQQQAAIVAMEACGSAHHWGRLAAAAGHTVRILSPRAVKPYRQGHKTDHNDALAIAIACVQPQMKFVGLKNLEQQSLQSDKRMQEHVSDQLTATGNLLRGLLAEFGIALPQGAATLKARMPELLEDGENGLPLSVRESLYEGWTLWQQQSQTLQRLERLLQRRVQETPACQRLQQLESVGSKNAIGLYVALGDARQYKNGREAAACIGVTPKQSSTGGKVRLGSIGKHCGNQRLRSSLIVGAFSMVNALSRREPKNDKERWLKALIDRRGAGRAAVALANKTVRTAWAMLYYNTPYEPMTRSASASA
jgi:transposase